MAGRSPLVVVTEKQYAILKEFAAARTVSVDLSQRSKIILLAFEKKLNQEISQQVGLHRNHVGRWRERWKNAFHDLVATECNEGISALKKKIVELLSDKPRSGRRPTVTSEQKAQLVSVACEEPKESGLPRSRWTSEELANELMRRDIFEAVSSSSVRRWLDELDLKPHRHKYWLFSPIRRTPEYEAKVRLICDIYSEAIEAYESYGIQKSNRDVPKTDEDSGLATHCCKFGNLLFGNAQLRRNEIQNLATAHGMCLLLWGTHTGSDWISRLHGKRFLD